jgi:hypothetical protein
MKTSFIRTALLLVALITSIASSFAQSPTPETGKKLNILVIFGDDIGQTNVSAYSFGLLGYKTPAIDRIAKEGMTLARTPGRSFLASPTRKFFTRLTV